MSQVPTIGRIVYYTLSADDAEAINRRRADAQARIEAHRTAKTGVQIHWGNHAAEGMQCPMLIVKVWGADPGSAVNGQVFLDGNDVFWATSRCVGEGPGTFAWPAWSSPPKAAVKPTSEAS